MSILRVKRIKLLSALHLTNKLNYELVYTVKVALKHNFQII